MNPNPLRRTSNFKSTSSANADSAGGNSFLSRTIRTAHSSPYFKYFARLLVAGIIVLSASKAFSQVPQQPSTPDSQKNGGAIAAADTAGLDSAFCSRMDGSIVNYGNAATASHDSALAGQPPLDSTSAKIVSSPQSVFAGQLNNLAFDYPFSMGKYDYWGKPIRRRRSGAGDLEQVVEKIAIAIRDGGWNNEVAGKMLDALGGRGAYTFILAKKEGNGGAKGNEVIEATFSELKSGSSGGLSTVHKSWKIQFDSDGKIIDVRKD